MTSEFNDQVTSIALTDISGALGISHDSATWIESLYVSAEIIGMAISPWLLGSFTLRRWTLFSIALFGAWSWLIPFSSNIEAIYALRFLLALASAVAIPLLLVNEWFHPLPLLKLQMLGRRNFAYGALGLFTFLVISQSGSSVPLRYLQEVQGYRPLQSNLITLEIAALQLVMLPAMALLLDYKRADSRVVSLVGLGLILASCIGSSFVTVYWNRDQFYILQLLQAVGQPTVIMPLLMMVTNSVAGPPQGPFSSSLLNKSRAVAEAAGAWFLALIDRWRNALHSDRIIDEVGQDPRR